MDIERLTKTQIVLLTLLVSFVTSIATGIVTVSLIEQAPPALTRTINRVVEHTIERVAADASSTPQSKTASVSESGTSKETTVVVKETDLITEAVDKNIRKVVRVTTNIGSREAPQVGDVAALGIVMTREGVVATNRASLSENEEYLVVTSNNEIYRTTVVGQSDIITLLAPIPKENAQSVFSPVSPGGEAAMKLGQTVLTLGGATSDAVSVGIISSLARGGDATSPITHIDTDIVQASVLPGSPLLSIYGDVLGIQTSNLKGTYSYTPIAEIVRLISPQ